MKPKVNIAAIITFYILAISLRFVTNKTNLLDSVGNNFLKTILQGIGPAMGAVVVFYLFKIKPLLSLKGNFKNFLLPFGIFWGLPILLITAYVYTTKGYLPIDILFAVLVYGALEEIGWRGFLHQSLYPINQWLRITIIAVMWFVWHLNFELSFSNFTFFAILFLGSWGIGKVADKTLSLFAVSAFHSLNNFFGQIKGQQLIILLTLAIAWVLFVVFQDRIQVTKQNIH